MEEPRTLTSSDGHTIYGVLNTSIKKADTLLVLVHGLTGDMTDHIFYNGARFFPQKGIDVFRFNLYDGRDGARSLVTTTVKDHADDLNVVLREFRDAYRYIAVAGHSLGGPSVITADTSLMDAIILWDPTDMPGLRDVAEGMKHPLKRVASLKAYLAEWNFTFLFGDAMAKEYQTLKPVRHVSKVKVPMHIICAEKEGNAKPGKMYFDKANPPKRYVIVEGATHCFDEWGTEERLFEETLSWIRRWCA